MNIAALIPSYNAASTLPELIDRTSVFVPRERIVVVNDGSTDGTSSIAGNSGVTVLNHRTNRGKGAALQTGFDHIAGTDADAVLTLDADLQHLPERIPAFIDEAERSGADVILGSRMKETSSMPLHRFLSNTITSALVRLRTGAAIEDSQSGFRFIRRRVLDRVRLSSDGFEAETEFLIKAAAAGFTFGSVAVPTIYAGERSHMTHFRTTVRFITVLLKRY